MITAEIEGKIYNISQEWSDVTLEKYIELCDIPIPEKLSNLWVTASGDDEKKYRSAADALTHEDIIKTFPEYYGKVIALLTDIPGEIIDRMDGSLRDVFFNQCFRHFIYTMFTPLPMVIDGESLKPFEPEKIKSFNIGKETFYLPRSLKVYGEEVPLGEETIMTFAEAADIEIALRHLSEGSARRLPMFISVYCRKRGEQYNEKVVMRREGLFRKVPMNVVWEVFFCISEHYVKYMTYTLQFLKGMERLYLETSSPAG